MMNPWEFQNNLCQVKNPQNPLVFQLWKEAKRRQWILDQTVACGDFDAEKKERGELLAAMDDLIKADLQCCEVHNEGN